MKKLMASALSLCLALGVLAGCGNSGSSSTGGTSTGNDGGNVSTGSGNGISFSWWGGDSRHEATQAAVAAFTEKTGIEVSTNYGAWSGWEDSMSTAFYAGTAQDVNQTNWSWIYNYDNGTTFVDLNEYADIIDLSQFDQGALDQCTIDGRLLMIPVAMTGKAFFWNEATFEAAGLSIPESWDDLLNAGSVFASELGDGYYPLQLGEYDRVHFMVWWLESKYGKAWVENNEMQYTLEEITEALEMLTSLEEAHVIPTIQTVNGDGADSLDQNPKWMDGRYAGVFEWDTGVTKFANALDEGQSLVLGNYLSGVGSNNGGFTKVSMGFSITQTASDKEAAAQLINYLLNDEEGALLMAGERGVPLSQAGLAVAVENELVNPEIAAANALAIANCKFPLDPMYEDSRLNSNPDGIYYEVMAGLSYGDYTAEEAAELLIEGVERVLASA